MEDWEKQELENEILLENVRNAFRYGLRQCGVNKEIFKVIPVPTWFIRTERNDYGIESGVELPEYLLIDFDNQIVYVSEVYLDPGVQYQGLIEDMVDIASFITSKMDVEKFNNPEGIEIES